MSEIKSEKAKEHIREYILDKKFNDGLEHPCVRAETAVLAVHYAEIEAEECYTRELQQYQKAIEDGKQREAVAAKIITDKRNEVVELAEQLQELKEYVSYLHEMVNVADHLHDVKQFIEFNEFKIRKFNL